MKKLKIKLLSVIIAIFLIVLGRMYIHQSKDDKKYSHIKPVLPKQEIIKDSTVLKADKSTEKKNYQTSFISTDSQQKDLLNEVKILKVATPLPGILTDDEFELRLARITRDQIYKTMDKIMNSWPKYSDVQEQLRNELLVEFNFENLSNEKLTEIALELREQFWKTGGNFSLTSYKYAYKARILLELARDRKPEDMAITDELVETIQSTWVRWNFKDNSDHRIQNNTAIEILQELRSEQYEQIKKEVERGHTLSWEDFFRINDQAWLLQTCGDYESATKTIEWLIHEIGYGELATYAHPLKEWQQHLKVQKGYSYNIYIATKAELPEEIYPYSRRLPSFKGSAIEKRGVAPVHLAGGIIDWK